MIATDLLRRPQQAIAARLADEQGSWLLPLVGYALFSLAEGHDRIVTRFPDVPPALLVLCSIAFAALIGSWLWAFAYGGALHVGARILGGRPGLRLSTQALGYALLWPGVLAAPCAVALSHIPQGSGLLAVALLLNLAGGVWGLYTAIAAIRMRHSFSWGRAIATWVLTLLTLAIVGLGLLSVLRLGATA